jgi:hypothetical protein
MIVKHQSTYLLTELSRAPVNSDGNDFILVSNKYVIGNNSDVGSVRITHAIGCAVMRNHITEISSRFSALRNV